MVGGDFALAEQGAGSSSSWQSRREMVDGGERNGAAGARDGEVAHATEEDCWLAAAGCEQRRPRQGRGDGAKGMADVERWRLPSGSGREMVDGGGRRRSLFAVQG
ncbi:unnamed protein product [Linum trigynum]|uniref:Uncharacterized protein n=1 Tax=Linum trigynum TaxID=586398 RepID=A0AAV2FF48_9ROSI